LLIKSAVRSGDDGRIEHRPAIPFHKLEIFADDVSHVCAASQRDIDHIRNKSIFINLIGELNRVVANRCIGYKFFLHKAKNPFTAVISPYIVKKIISTIK